MGVAKRPNADGLAHVLVVSALVRNAVDQRDILLGVRKRVHASPRHPGVLSTFTTRVPQAVFDVALSEAYAHVVPYPVAGEVAVGPIDNPYEFGEPGGFSCTATFLVEALLARKLGLADELVTGALHGTIKPLGIATDWVDDPKGGFAPELTTMLTYLVEFERESVAVPKRTVSYDPIAWVDARDLARAVVSHDALILLPDANPWEVCLHGLCMRSAVDLLMDGDSR